MPGRKDKAVDAAIVAEEKYDAPIPASKIPLPVQFPLVAILSLSSSVLLFSWISHYTAGEFVAISRTVSDWSEVGALLGLRIFELGLGWFGNYDGYDLVALTLLSHGPSLYLLTTFYNVSPITTLSSLAIDAFTTYLPFRLLRPLSLAHSSSASPGRAQITNREIVTDLPIQVLTTILAAGIYSVTLYTAYKSFLPLALVTFFNNIPTIEPAHAATPITLLPFTLTLGFAARSFIFTPAAASSSSLSGTKAATFNPVTASLLETIEYNFWGFSPRTKVVISRTGILMLASSFNTFLQVLVTIEGVEAPGAAAYACVWAVAALVTGFSLGLVGDV